MEKINFNDKKEQIENHRDLILDYCKLLNDNTKQLQQLNDDLDEIIKALSDENESNNK